MNAKQIAVFGLVALVVLWAWTSHGSETSWARESNPVAMNSPLSVSSLTPSNNVVPVTLPNGQAAYLTVAQNSAIPAYQPQLLQPVVYTQPAVRRAVVQRTPVYRSRPAREVVRTREAASETRRTRRSWKKEALIIGGSAGAGAAIGGVAGGKKGAAVGALAGGAAGLVYDLATRNN